MLPAPAPGPDPLLIRQRVLMRAITSLVAWVATFFFVFPAGVDLNGINRLLLFGLIVVAPLPAALVVATEADARVARLLRLALRLYLPAAIVAVGAILLPAGPLAAALVVPWLGVTVLIGLAGLLRLRSHPLAQMEELSVDAGLLYLPVGGIWLLLSRLGVNPLAFGDTTVLLTAVHFHFAGYAAPVIAGLTGRRLRALAPGALAAYRFAALGIIAGMALVALGITFTAVSGVLLPEVLAVLLLVVSMLGLALLVLRYVLPGAEQAGTRIFFLVSGLAPLAAMVVALGYAGGRLSGTWSISIEQMVEWHGYLNALGFVFCALMAWLLSPSTLGE